MGAKEHIGLTLDGNLLKIARIKKVKKVWKLIQLDKLEVNEETDQKEKKKKSAETVSDLNEDFHFGIDEEYDETTQSNGDFDLSMTVDDYGSSDVFNSNVGMLKDELEEIDDKKLEVSITIEMGNTNFRVFKDRDFSQMKSKELQAFIEDHLQKIYSLVPNSDQYKYRVRDDGSLLLASYQEKPILLQMLDKIRILSSTKVKIKQMLPDECVLAALVRKNYKLKKDEITCVLHIGFKCSRIIFMRGDQIQHLISPLEKGRESSKVLEIIFSKILFQLDTGEVSGLDRILVTNNDLKMESIDYFRKQFPDIHVDEFIFKTDYLEVPDHLNADSAFFTSAIGTAIAGAELKDPDFAEYAMLPTYVRERQKVFKLRWHGMVLLLMLLATPVLWNNLYQEKQQQIMELNDDLARIEMSIMELENIAEKTAEVQNQYEVEKSKMDLLNRLDEGTYYWSETLKTLNDGLRSIQHVWIDRINYNDDGFMLQGYSTTRGRIPLVTNLFEWADLKAVSVVQMRDIKVYKFSIQVYKGLTEDLDSKFEARSGE